MLHRFATVILSIAIFACPVLAQEKTEGESEHKSKPVTFAKTKISVVPPATWKSMPPKNSMIETEFRFPEEGDSHVRITFSQSGGTIDANIKRWIGQFEGAKKEDTKVEKKDIAKLTVHIVDVSGTFLDNMGGGPFAPGPVKKRDDYRTLGAIIEIPNGQSLYIKSNGPKDLIEKTKEDFLKMIDELTNENE